MLQITKRGTNCVLFRICKKKIIQMNLPNKLINSKQQKLMKFILHYLVLCIA